MITTDWKIIGPLMGAMVGLFGWFAKHISNSKKHPCKDNIVYKDVCDARGIDNDKEHQHLKEGIEDLKDETRQGFVTVNKSMEKGFDRMDDLIRNIK